MSALAADRGATWSYDEVKALIRIWADEKVQHQLDNCTKKVPVFRNIAKRFEEAGFTRSFIHFREKFKKLKQQYKKVKDNNNLLGRERKTFKLYDEIDEIGQLQNQVFSRVEQILRKNQAVLMMISIVMSVKK